MEPPAPRSVRGQREPSAQVKRLESQAVLGPKPTSPARGPSRVTQESPRGSDDSASDSSSKKGGDAPNSSGSSHQSFQEMRATVAENRRREHRTPSTALSPTASTLRKAHYLKSKAGRVVSISSTRAMMHTPSTWVSMGPRATSVRHKHTCVSILGGDMLLFYGGCTNAGTAPTQTLLTYQISTRVWNTPVPRKRVGPREEYVVRRISDASIPDPPPDDESDEDRSEYVPMKEISSFLENRFGHSAVVWSGCMWIFGGQTSTTGTSSLISNSMLAYHIERNEWWHVNPEPESSLPQPRRGHSATVFGDSMVIFGGCGANSENYNDIWLYRFKENVWSKVEPRGTVPSPRFFHTAEVIDHHLYLFGGFDGTKDYNDLYVCNLNTFTWRTVELSGETPIKPPPKHSARFCAFDDKLILVGGTSPLDDYALDLYVYHTKKHAWFLQRYEVEDSSHLEGSSPPSVSSGGTGLGGPGSSHSHINDSMTARYTMRPDSLMTLDKRNRVYHTATLSVIPDIGDNVLVEIYVFGGVNGHLANVLDVVSMEFTESPETLDDSDPSSFLSSLPPEEWEAAAMYYNPEILALSERIRMLSGEPSFARNPDNSGRTQATCNLGNGEALMLVMEWLMLNGYRSTVARLVRDTRKTFVRLHESRGSALELLLSFARRRVKRGTSIWDDQVLSIVGSNGAVQAIDHLPDWYHDLSRDVIHSQNPWDEAISEDNLRVDPETFRVLFGTLNALIILTLDYANFVNQNASVDEIDDYIAVFFHTYHSFTSPIVLLEKFIQLFELSNPESIPEDVVTAHRTRILEMILVWIDLASWDWTNEYLTQKLKDFVDGPLVNTDLRWMAPQIKQALAIAIDFKNSPAAATSTSTVISNTGKIKTQAITTNQLMAMNPLPGTQRLRSMIMEQLGEAPDPIVKKSIFSSHHTLDDVHEIELARQLTIIQFSLFCMIKPSELLNGWWKSEDAEYRAPHVRVCMNRATVITDWVVASISRPGDDKKARGRAVERFFKLAEQLRHLNNFETLSAVLAGLRQAPEDLIERVDKRTLEALYKLDTSISTHNEVIDYLDVLTPCVPNLRLLLKQIGKIEDEAELLVVQPAKIGRPLVNMHKCRSLYLVLRRTITLQARFYNLLPVYQIISPLRTPGSSVPDSAASASLRIMLSPRVQQ